MERVMSCGFLYILSEGETSYSKIGINQDHPWERLRKLQQGNPRKLEFCYLWVGNWYTVNKTEMAIKSFNNNNEWHNLSPYSLYKKVLCFIDEHNIDLVQVIENVPYKHHSYGTCPWYKNNIKPIDLYKNISGRTQPSESVVHNKYNVMFSPVV